jgi:hypothetical protein
MGERPRDEEARAEGADPSPLPADEPEPPWAGEIRSLRQARGDRLKEIFAGFDDEEER